MNMNKIDANLCYQFLVAHANSTKATMLMTGMNQRITIRKDTVADTGEPIITLLIGDGDEWHSFPSAEAFAQEVGLFKREPNPRNNRVYPILSRDEDAAFKSAFRLYLLANCPEYKDIEALATMLSRSRSIKRRPELRRLRNEFNPRRLELLALFTDLWRTKRAAVNAYINDNHKEFRAAV